MKPTLIVLAFAVACSTAIAADNPAPATTSATADECTTLQAKYDVADKSKVSPNKMKEAKAQRVKGGDLCAKGNKTEGVKALKNALAEIGVN